LTLLTVRKDDPSGLGRIIRDHQGKIKRIVEEKDASQEEKGIKEINTGCYCFQRQFVKEYLPQIKKNFLKGEYYLTDIVSLGIKGKRKVTAVRIGRGEYFQGVNTKEQFLAAEAKMKKLAKQKAG